jgi:hypothetical protein
MAKLQAMWVHGSSVKMEREGYFVSKQRAGNGAIFRTHGKEWFHFSIPTPVILNGQRSRLKKVFVFYKTEGTAKITAIHVYDAGKKIDTISNLGLSGDHSKSDDKHNSWVVATSPEMKFGLGISVHVDFGPPTNLGVPTIRFTTAGADFETP